MKANIMSNKIQKCVFSLQNSDFRLHVIRFPVNGNAVALSHNKTHKRKYISSFMFPVRFIRVEISLCFTLLRIIDIIGTEPL